MSRISTVFAPIEGVREADAANAGAKIFWFDMFVAFGVRLELVLLGDGILLKIIIVELRCYFLQRPNPLLPYDHYAFKVRKCIPHSSWTWCTSHNVLEDSRVMHFECPPLLEY